MVYLILFVVIITLVIPLTLGRNFMEIFDGVV